MNLFKTAWIVVACIAAVPTIGYLLLWLWRGSLLLSDMLHNNLMWALSSATGVDVEIARACWVGAGSLLGVYSLVFICLAFFGTDSRD